MPDKDPKQEEQPVPLTKIFDSDWPDAKQVLAELDPDIIKQLTPPWGEGNASMKNNPDLPDMPNPLSEEDEEEYDGPYFAPVILVNKSCPYPDATP